MSATHVFPGLLHLLRLVSRSSSVEAQTGPSVSLSQHFALQARLSLDALLVIDLV